MTMPFILRDSHQYLWAVLIGLTIGLASLVSPLIPIAVIGGLVFVVAALRRPVVLCYLLIAAVVFFSGMPRGDLIPLFIPNEPILLLVAGIGFFIILMRTRKPPLSNSVIIAVLILAAGTAVLPLVAYKVRNYGLTVSDIFSLLAPLQYPVIAWLFAYLPQNETQRHRIIQWMLFCSSIVALIGILQAMQVGFVVNLLNTWYPSPHEADAANLGRVTSLLGAWNSLGNFLMINLILILSLQNYPRKLVHNINVLVALALNGTCLIASGSFASIIGLFLSLFIIKLFDRRGYKVILLLLLGLALGALLLQSLVAERLAYQFREGGLVPETLMYRFDVWQKIFLPMVEKNPFWGVSPTFIGYATWGWAESQYLYLLFRSGLVSLIAHVLFVSIMLGYTYRRIRSSAGLDRFLAIALFAILAVLSIMGFTNEVFTSSGAIDYVWILIGLVAPEHKRLLTFGSRITRPAPGNTDLLVKEQGYGDPHTGRRLGTS